MGNPVDTFWKIRLEETKKQLESNNFQVFIVKNLDQVKQTVLNEILPSTIAKSISWGGSMTFMATGLYDVLKKREDLTIIDTFEKGLSQQETIDRRRRSLLVDLFITGTNAITEGGQLVNLDMIGNRICGITFGPKYVIVLVGRNKIVPDLESAIYRIKNYSAPANSMRLEKKNPCVKTSFCEECKSPDRICNTWTITEKSFPKERVKIVLINDELGL